MLKTLKTIFYVTSPIVVYLAKSSVFTADWTFLFIKLQRSVIIMQHFAT